MSQEEIYAILSDVPMTQKEIQEALGIPYMGTVANNLGALKRKGMIRVVTLDLPYKPNGYIRADGKESERKVFQSKKGHGRYLTSLITRTGKVRKIPSICYRKEAKAMLEGKHTAGKNRCVDLPESCL